MKKILLIKYGEISLRKGNRALYERQLMATIRKRLGPEGFDGTYHVIREQGRILVEDMRGDVNNALLWPKLATIFGLIGICVAVKAPVCDIATLQKTANDFFCTQSVCGSFKVAVKRSDKKYPHTSNEVAALVGGFILDSHPQLTVDLNHPDHVLWIEIRNHIYLYCHTLPCEGGLPYGASGKGVLLLSGGIDSPVAGYLMARRGVELVPVYFHSPPYTSERVADKVRDLTARLARFTDGLRLYIVPFMAVQLYLHERVQPEKLTLLLKRAMLHIASRLAVRENAQCIITGDSVGQVASQTIRSLQAVDSASALPVLRPLAAMDKQQIIDTARRIDTYDISIRPYEDCCTLFVARHPESKPKASIIEAIEKRLDALPALLEEAVENAVVYEIGFSDGSFITQAISFQGCCDSKA
jgi:thiamine biosynthesis protein ThiI